jgi:NAD(P)-dependent dehydrogenase (short-subunit alcohol dehydrogenase family)
MENATKGGGRLAGKTAVVTGGSSGIGLETARQFLAQGARVMITGLDGDRLAAAVRELGEDAVGFVSDARSSSDLDRLAAQVRAEFGELDVLFANAGIGRFAPLDQVDEAFFDDQFDTNVRGLFFTVQKLAPLLRDGASVILNASAVNAKGVAGGHVYFASKAAVRSLARSLAAELAPRRIRVNALSPGLVPTNFQSKMGLPQEALDGFAGYIAGTAPLGRVGRTDEIAPAAVFLASDEASYITATDLLVDGGWMSV